MDTRSGDEWIATLVQAIHSIRNARGMEAMAIAVREACATADEACQVFDIPVEGE